MISSPSLPLLVMVPAFFLLPQRAGAANPALAASTSTGTAPIATTSTAPVLAPDAVKITGAEVIETKGQMTGLSFKDATSLTPADYQQIRQLQGLKTLSFAHGPDDASLKLLAGMPSIESFTTNGIQASDAGIATLATFPNLRVLTFFHPDKAFTGTGLAALAALPHLESFSVGGSTKFADAGLATVAGLTHLKELRIWHTGATSAGVKALLALKELKSLTLGQQLDSKSPATLNDDAVAVIAELPSLETLTLEEARLSLPALAKLKQLPNLKRLTLDSIDIPESDIAALKLQLPKTDIKWTAPKDRRRIDALFGAPATAIPPAK